jgi:hypothetical protein
MIGLKLIQLILSLMSFISNVGKKRRKEGLVQVKGQMELGRLDTLLAQIANFKGTDTRRAHNH